MNYQTKLMDWETFTVVLQRLPKTVQRVALFNLGEPFLNPHLLPMITALHEAQREVTIHSNFSLIWPNSFFRELVLSGLKRLVISLDGATAETYRAYRQGGDFNLVLANLRRLRDAQRQLGESQPQIFWKMLVNRCNEHEVLQAQQLAEELEISFMTDQFGLGDDLVDYQISEPIGERMLTWLPESSHWRKPCYRRPYSFPLLGEPCAELFTCPVVKPDGKVVPCCWVTDERNAFGNLLEQPFETIWNNSCYLRARSLFTGEAAGAAQETVCESCHNYTTVNCRPQPGAAEISSAKNSEKRS